MSRRQAMDFLKDLEEMLGGIEGYQLNADNTRVTACIGRPEAEDRQWMAQLARIADWKRTDPLNYFDAARLPDDPHTYLCFERDC